MVSRPVIEFRTDERLHLGEFGIQARLVRPDGRGRPSRPTTGHTMVYSTSDRVAGVADRVARRAAAGRAILQAEGTAAGRSRPAARCVGRSRECDVVLDDANVSRHHAEIRPGAGGQWTVARPRLDQRRAGQRPPRQRPRSR